VFYLDEMWVNQNYTFQYTWQKSTRNGGLKIPVREGSHLIICHTESDDTRSRTESKWVFQFKSTCDYPVEMTTHTFQDWVLNIQCGSNMTGTDCIVRTIQSVPVIFEPPCIY
jgi:hypothetical protein